MGLEMVSTATFKAPTADDIDPSWSRIRQYLATVFSSMAFDIAVGVVVAFNLVFVVLETDVRAGGLERLPTWIPIANNVLLTIYFVEVAAKMARVPQTWWISLTRDSPRERALLVQAAPPAAFPA